MSGPGAGGRRSWSNLSWRVLTASAAVLILIALALGAGMLLEEMRLALRENEIVRYSRDRGRILALHLARDLAATGMNGSTPDSSEPFVTEVSRVLRTRPEVAYVDVIGADGRILWSSEGHSGRWSGGPPEPFLHGSEEGTRVPGAQPIDPDIFVELVTQVGDEPGAGVVVIGLSEARIAEELRAGFWRTMAWLGGIGLVLLSGFGVTYRILSRRSAAEVLRRARDEHMAQIGLLAAGLAHELRNPLNAMRFAVDSLRQRVRLLHEVGAAPEVDQISKEIGSEVDDLQRIVSSFLDYARPVREQAEWCDVREICASARSQVAPRSNEMGVEVVLELGPEPLSTEALAGSLRQVLVNLLTNAMEASARGQHVRLRAACDRSHIRLAVEDEGRGVAPEMQRRLFEPFSTGRPDGTGLGLAVCRKLAGEMGGAISYHPQRPRGSIFELVLPRHGTGPG